jgi:sulfur carrier protein ThiS
MDVHLGGHLAFYDRAKRTRFEVRLATETALRDLVRELGIPEEEIELAAVNLAVVSLADARVVDADRVDLYPPMSGGSLLADGRPVSTGA